MFSSACNFSINIKELEYDSGSTSLPFKPSSNYTPAHHYEYITSGLMQPAFIIIKSISMKKASD